MKILASQLHECVIFTLATGEHIEITMLLAEDEDVLPVPDIQIAIQLLCDNSNLVLD